MRRLEIARQHLIPKQVKDHGLKEEEFALTQTTALQEMIRTYTREAGVRNLEREIARLTRKGVTQIVKGEASEQVDGQAGGSGPTCSACRALSMASPKRSRSGRRHHRPRLDRSSAVIC